VLAHCPIPDSLPATTGDASQSLPWGDRGFCVSLRAMIGVGVLLGALYAVGMAIRGDVVPGLVGGVLAGVLCVLVLRQVEARRRNRR
jgi:hypothetical protein